MRQDRLFQGDAGVIVADRDATDVRRGREVRRKRRVDRTGGHHGHAPRRQRVARERRHVAAFRQFHRRADVDRPGVGFGNDVESLHSCRTAM